MSSSRPLTRLARLAPRGPAALLASLSLAAALTEGLGLILLVPLLGLVSDRPASGGIAAAWQQLGLPLALGPLLLAFVFLVALRAAIVHFRLLAAQTCEAALVDGLRRRAWNALLHCNWRVLGELQRAASASLLLTSIERVGNGVNQLLMALAGAITLAGLGIAALAISPAMAAAALAGGLLVLLGFRRLRRRAAGQGEELGRAYEALHGFFGEALGGLRVIKSLGAEPHAAAAGSAAFARLRRAQWAFLRGQGRAQIALQGGGAALLALLVWLALARWQLDLAQVLPLVALFARALPLVGAIQQGWQNWAHARPALDEALALIDRTEQASEAQQASAGPPPQLREAITLTGVSVAYAGRAQPALAEIDLVIPAGAALAIAGPSGAGKSTLADLIAGLILPDAGEIGVDGQALRREQLRAWRRQVGYVQQEPVLFSGTVRENLRWAMPQAEDAALWAALDAAAAGFVTDLPGGLDCFLGEGGRQLSGGERQRLALARALLAGPQVLVLDEATSALDPASEVLVRAALERLRGQLTIVIVSHRGELAAIADCSVTLSAGRIVARREVSQG